MPEGWTAFMWRGCGAGPERLAHPQTLPGAGLPRRAGRVNGSHMQTSTPEPEAPSAAAAWLRLGAGFDARGKLETALLYLERARVQMLAYARRSELLSWPAARPPHADELLLAPPNLRVPDPSFVDELRCGNFGLVGEMAELRGRSPFARAPVSALWARELHGFSWLRHLDAVRAEDTERIARRLLRDWLHTGSRDRLYAWAPEATGRRLKIGRASCRESVEDRAEE